MSVTPDDIAFTGALQFFSNEPLKVGGSECQALFGEEKRHHNTIHEGIRSDPLPLSLSLSLPLSSGVLGALPLAAAIGVVTGAFTCLFMYYDSDVPGDFPPTPVSPRKASE